MDRKTWKLTCGALSLIAWNAWTGDAEAGTRLIPPPPPRYLESESQAPASYWGEQPANPYRTEEEQEPTSRRRLGALEDDEGREIDFNAGSRRNRAPAGLEVSATTSKESVPRKDQKPRLSVKPVSSSEKMRQDDRTESVVADLADPIERRKGVQEVAVIAGDLGFFPKTIFVSRDVPVRLFVTGASKQNLCLMMDTFNVRKQVRASKIEEITFMPTQPGTYRFYCPINNGEGTLVVKELTTASESVEN